MAFAALLLSTACRTASPSRGASTSALPSDGGSALPGASVVRVYDTRASRWIPFETMTRSIASADLVFLGEQHNDPVTHGVELAVLAAMGAERGRVILSLEMFERDVQAPLDRYLSGMMPEAAFLGASRPWDNYVTDYRPMVELARVRGWPVVAANIPRPIASAVSRRGLAHLDTLSATTRTYAAAVNQCPHDRYYALFTETMGGHSAGGGPPTAADDASARAVLDKFYEAQCTKDEAMGESVANAFLRDNRRTPVLHVDGAFHSDFGLGTAERARRRVSGARSVVLSAVPVTDLANADPAAHRARGDYIIFTKQTSDTGR